MKLFQMTAAILAICAALSARAQNTTPVKVQTHFGHIYAVDGFDNNDNVQIVGEGAFPNSCFRNAETLVNVDHRSKTILLTPLAYKYPGLCLDVMMPFDRVIEVGLLNEGTYRIMQQGDTRELGHLRVKTTISQEPDDRLYAPISQALVQPGPETARVYLTGDFPLSCMKLTEVKADIQPDVLVILPLAEIDHSVPCVKGRFHFDRLTDVGAIKPGRYLLHVRSMNGKSVNSLFDVR